LHVRSKPFSQVSAPERIYGTGVSIMAKKDEDYLKALRMCGNALSMNAVTIPNGIVTV